MKSQILIATAVLGLVACSTPQHSGEELVHATKSTDVRNPSAVDNTADYIKEGGPATALENCGGKDGRARLKRAANGALYLQVENMECASWATSKDGFQPHPLERVEGGRDHDGKIIIDEAVTGYRTIIIGSANFIGRYAQSPASVGNTKGDIVKFYVAPRKVVLDLRGDWDGKTNQMVLSQCGGTVEAKINKDRSLSVIFRGVSYCGNFGILKNNGDAIMKAYDLQEQKGSLGGAYTISGKDLDWGSNSIEMAVYTPFGREDRIVLRVLAF